MKEMNKFSNIGVTLCLLAVPALLAQESGRIKAVGKPGNAGVWIDGKYVGPASRFTVAEKYEASAGEVEVSIREPRYEDFTTKVTVRPGKTTKVKYSLKKVEPAKPPFGRLRLGGGEPESYISVTAGDVSPVFINGKFYGYIDELNNAGSGILLNPGTYEVSFESPLFGSVKQTVTIEANKVTVIPLQRR
jgi:hypothetical protein